MRLASRLDSRHKKSRRSGKGRREMEILKQFFDVADIDKIQSIAIFLIALDMFFYKIKK